jgi:hypothetical protein
VGATDDTKITNAMLWSRLGWFDYGQVGAPSMSSASSEGPLNLTTFGDTDLSKCQIMLRLFQL